MTKENQSEQLDRIEQKLEAIREWVLTTTTAAAPTVAPIQEAAPVVPLCPPDADENFNKAPKYFSLIRSDGVCTSWHMNYGCTRKNKHVGEHHHHSKGACLAKWK